MEIGDYVRTRAASPSEVTGPAIATDVPSSGDAMEQLRKLGELRDAGVLTPEEFDAKKTELLSRL